MERISRRQTMPALAAILAIAAGSAVGTGFVVEQPKRDNTTQRSTPDRGMNRDRGMTHHFMLGSKLIGQDVVNANGETIGEIDNFIFERGSGRISYGLVETGTILGMGGKTIAVPYARFGTHTDDTPLTLDMTPEQVKRAAEFVPENWSNLKQRSWLDDVDNAFRDEPDRTGEWHDPYATAIAAATRQNVKGEIISVRRLPLAYEEDVMIIVRTDDGTSRELLLGPSWYVMGHDAAPMRGDKINADVRMIEADGGTARYYATSATFDGKTLPLRADDASPMWRLSKEVNRNTPNDTSPDRRAIDDQNDRSAKLMLLSDLIGADARAFDKDGGEVQDVVVECNSGHVALICFDPDEAILGIGDTNRAVPWQVTNIGPDGKVRFDADRAMLTAAPEVPEDLNSYTSGTQLPAIYRTFNVDQPKFDRYIDGRQGDSPRPGNMDGRGKPMKDSIKEPMDNMTWMKARNDGKQTSITGKVSSTQSESIARGEAQTRTLTLSTPNGERQVVLGPAWYIDRQNLKFSNGDEVSVDGRRVEIDGKTYIVANTVRNGTSTCEMWKDDQPAWARK